MRAANLLQPKNGKCVIETRKKMPKSRRIHSRCYGSTKRAKSMFQCKTNMLLLLLIINLSENINWRQNTIVSDCITFIYLFTSVHINQFSTKNTLHQIHILAYLMALCRMNIKLHAVDKVADISITVLCCF